MSLTPLVDIASSTMAANGALSSTFRFTDGNDVVNGMTATMEVGDTLIDNSTTDNDVLNITATGTTAITTVNIETINFTASSGTPILNAATMTGVKDVNVTGTVAARLNDVDSAATINLAGYTRVLTIFDTDYDGTTANGNPDVLNVSVSGATHGTTAATQTGITLISDNASVLETLNIASTGTAANAFTLDAGTNVTLSTVNVTGTADATIRVEKADVSGVTIDGSKGTGSLSLSLDVNSTGATNVNGANWTGVNNIVLRDSATASATDDASINSLKSGHNIVVANSLGDLDVTVQGATFSALADKATLTLNGTSTTAGVTVVKYDLQNVKALDLVSTGLASSTATTAANKVTTLNGDFTTIKISGDTSLEITNLDIDDTQTATSATTARVVTLDASSMTGNAFVNITAVNDAKVSYNITGTAKDDTITLNNSGGKITVSAGKNTLKGGDGKDTIIGGSGDDLIVITFGADTVTGGAGKNTFDINAASANASAQTVTTSNVLGAGPISVDSDDQLVAVVNGVSYASNFSGGTATAKALNDIFIAEHGIAILAATGIEVTTAGASDVSLLFTGKSDGTAFTADVTTFDDGVAVAVTETVVAGVAAKVVNTTITDFAAGDILDVAGLLTSAGAYHEGSAADAADGDSIIVLTAVAFASAALAQAAIDINTTGDDGLIIFLNSTTGKAEAFYDVDTDVTNNSADGTTVFVFENITNLTDLASIMSADSFVV